jgi:glutamate racemase
LNNYESFSGVSPQAHIGVFDSGIGGLTVLRALRERLPQENFVYLGDTARLPYGTKSAASVVRYSVQAAQTLNQFRIKCLVVACNTASALALDSLRQTLAPLPVIGVVEPGAEAGCRASRSGRIAVIATEGTVRGGAYEHAIRARRPEAHIVTRACSLFVALAEEGLVSGSIASAIAHHYLDDAFNLASLQRPDTLVLGCTHFPVLIDPLREVVGDDVTIVDSARTASITVEATLREKELLNANGGSMQLLATDSRERFARVGSVFLQEPMQAADVQLVDLG